MMIATNECVEENVTVEEAEDTMVGSEVKRENFGCSCVGNGNSSPPADIYSFEPGIAVGGR